MFVVESVFSFLLNNSDCLMLAVSLLTRLCKDLGWNGFAVWQSNVQKGCLSLEPEVTAGADPLCDGFPSS